MTTETITTIVVEDVNAISVNLDEVAPVQAVVAELPPVVVVPASVGIQGPPGPAAVVSYDTALGAYPSRPAVAQSVLWVGPVDPDVLSVDGDVWLNNA